MNSLLLPLRRSIYTKTIYNFGTRPLSTSPRASQYGLENLIASEDSGLLNVRSLTADRGFLLSNDLYFKSPIFLLNGHSFMWDVEEPKIDKRGINTAWQGWDPVKYSILDVVTPRPELLIIGTGKTLLFPPPDFRRHIRNLGIQVDIHDSRNACQTYNLLLEEGRHVAAALYPEIPYNAREN